MKRMLLLTVLSCSITFGQTFQIKGTSIMDPSGKKFIVKGTNVTGKGSKWPNNTLNDKDLIINTWRFNTIRIYAKLFTESSVGWDDLHAVVEAMSARKIVCLLDAHDHIGGYYSGADLTVFKKFWKDMATKYKNNTYVWFDLCNEPGGSTTDQTLWTNMYREAIKVIRDEVGASNIILIEGGAWGQDAADWSTGNVDPNKSAILRWMDNVNAFDGKTYQNIGASIHVYDQYKYGGAARIRNYINAVYAKGYPLVVGEWGSWNNKTCTEAMEAFGEVIKGSDVGRIVWHWYAGDGNALCTNGGGRMVSVGSDMKPTNLTALGKHVWFDNHSSPTGTLVPEKRYSGSGLGYPGFYKATLNGRLIPSGLPEINERATAMELKSE